MALPVATLPDHLAEQAHLDVLAACGKGGCLTWWEDKDITVIEYHPAFAPLASDYLRLRKSTDK
jgi:hypothetical protein